MAAPSGIVWGSIASSYYKLGIYTSLSNTNTQSTVSIQIWLWSKYTVQDNVNRCYFDNNATSASTLVKSNTSLNHTNASGSGWSTDNQSLITTLSYTYDRTTSAQTINCAAKMTSLGSSDATATVTTSYTIPILPTCIISYNANGGSGAPGSQTKYYGITITLSSTIPTRTGYTFLGWNYQSSTSSEVTHEAGAFYNATNTNTTLYAVWQPYTYTVSYDANGGSGAPASQTKTHDVTLTLSSTVPTKTNYNFLGWGTGSSSTTATYSAGGSYTTNAAVTLYAVWQLAYKKPRITNLKLARADSSGNVSDSGTYYNCYFEWATDYAVTSSSGRLKKSTDTSWSASDSLGLSGTSGTVNASAWGSGNLSTEYSYDIQFTISDSNGSTTVTGTIPSLNFAIDFKSGGKGVAIGKAAETDNLFDCNLRTKIRKPLEIGDNGKVLIHESTEGGNIRIYSPDDKNRLYEMDAYNGNLRIYTSTQDGPDTPTSNWTFSADGNTYFSNGLALKNWFDIKDSDGTTYWHAYVDNEGGNMELKAPSSYGNSYQFDAFDGNLRIFTYDTSSTIKGWAFSRDGSFTVSDGAAWLKNAVNSMGYFRMHNEWLGFYGSVSNAVSNSSRKGWIGFDGTTNFTVSNGSGGSNITSVAWTTSSDNRLKKDISDISDEFVKVWNELSPKMFKWNELNGGNNKYHFGLIAQDVISIFEKHGLDYKDYGFLNTFKMEGDDIEYFGIAYDEYHMLTSLVVKKQQEKIDSLEERITKLENLITSKEE